MVMTDEQAVEEKKYVLTLLDRCDSCNAQALVWANGVSGDLLFCGHHFRKYESKIREYAFEIIDEREKMIENKLIGEAHA
jgi:hypothetical protein